MPGAAPAPFLLRLKQGELEQGLVVWLAGSWRHYFIRFTPLVLPAVLDPAGGPVPSPSLDPPEWSHIPSGWPGSRQA
jgi:hypothetical protein